MLTPSVNIVQSSFAEEQQGEISGLSRSVSNLGSCLGTAIAGTILVAGITSTPERSYGLAMIALGSGRPHRTGGLGIPARGPCPAGRRPASAGEPAPAARDDVSLPPAGSSDTTGSRLRGNRGSADGDHLSATAWGGHSCPDATKHPKSHPLAGPCEIVTSRKDHPTASGRSCAADAHFYHNPGGFHAAATRVKDAITPIALPDGIKTVRFFSDQPAQLAVDTRDHKPVTKLDLGNASAQRGDRTPGHPRHSSPIALMAAATTYPSLSAPER